MNSSSPLLYKKTTGQVVEELRNGLAGTGWQQVPASSRPGAGEAMLRLFGRLADLVIARINQVPENHFRAFLESAGVDLLPPRPARSEITFYPAKDAPPLIRVPAGTQVAAKKSGERPEIVFETERDLNVVRAELACCIAVDPVRISDRSDRARGGGASFAAFLGDEERERILYLGDDALFVFPDDASRAGGTISLEVTLAVAGRPDLDGWRVEWLFFDGSSWQELAKQGETIVRDGSGGFARNGEISFTRLPALVKFPFDKSSGAWLACRLTGGSGRAHLPVIGMIRARRKIEIAVAAGKPADAALSAIHSGAALIALESGGEFFPLGQRPGRLDCFYLKADEAFAKQGALVEISLDLVGLSDAEQSALLAEPVVEWSYCSSDGWKRLGTSSRRGVEASVLDFEDQTRAFTHGGNGVKVSFRIPGEGGGYPLWAEAAVSGRKGFWLRARLLAGGYGLKPPAATIWEAPPVLAPSVKNLKVSYGGFSSSFAAPLPLGEVASLVDCRFSRHGFATGSAPFSPFGSSCDLPALYLGFSSPFPANEWIQLLLDLDEERIGTAELPLLLWEYWSSAQAGWAPLPASDESNGLRERGYLGFNGPPDQGTSVEFGRELAWLRVRPHRDSPLAVAAVDSLLTRDGNGEAVVSLDGSASSACNGQGIVSYRWTLLPQLAHGGMDQQVATTGSAALVALDASATAAESGRDIVRYHWRLVSSSHLIARAGGDLVITTSGSAATVSLDGSASRNTTGGTIRSYIWRKQLPEIVGQPATPYLSGIRCNTVPALNGISSREEILGSGNGKSGQRFRLLRAPVMEDLKLYVRESDQPPAEELDALRREIGAESEDDGRLIYPLVSQTGQGVWVRWQRVGHFFASGPSSRHFMLDARNGLVLFGDGTRGRRPALARDNIKALWYRSHQGAAANVESGAVTVLRNPGGDLAALKRVANREAAVGGGDGETLEQVRERGPKTIKHRGKAITLEDFAWLARDASGEVAAAWCLPTRDRGGRIREGWVTLVIIPRGSEKRPFPRPALLRLVREYLESRALVNLSREGRILVRGPDYIEVTVSVKIVPIHAEKGDEVKLLVERRLEAYFHPLAGGPLRKGWQLGRDVYISELYAEIEALPGVDHVADLELAGSLQQFLVELLPRQPVCHPAAEWSRVGTFDDRLRLILSETIEPGRGYGPVNRHNGQPLRVALYGFSVGERVRIVDSTNRTLLDELAISALAAANDSVTLVLSPSLTESLPPAESLALLSGDERVRIPLVEWLGGEGETVTARLMTITPGRDTLCIVCGVERYPEYEFMAVTAVKRRGDRVVIPEGHLAYSGRHKIEMTL